MGRKQRMDHMYYLLFGEIATNRCFYFRKDFGIESDLSKSVCQRESITFLDV